MSRTLLIVAILFLFACTATQPTKNEEQLYLDQNFFENKNSSAGWLAYGMALVAWEPIYLEDGTLDYFKREVSARKTAAKIWKELKQNKTAKSDTDLDILETISDAGFMDEYLWVYLKDDRWVNPGTLELEKFGEWASKNLVGHIPVFETGVAVGK